MHLNGIRRDAYMLYEAPADEGVIPPTDGDPSGETPSDKPTVAELQEQIKGLETRLSQVNSESAGRRKDNQQLTQELEKYRQAEMSEAEKAQAQIDAANEAKEQARIEVRKARAEVAIAGQAVTHGVNVELLGKLVEVQFDDDDQPTGIEEAVNKVLEDYPQLIPKSASGNPANPGRKGSLTMEQVKKMSVEEITARQDEVDAVLASSR